MGIWRYRWTNYWRRKGRPDVPVNLPVAPNPPTGLGSSAITDTSVTLTWTLSTSPGVTAQRIYLNNTLHTTVANGTSTSQTISGLTPGTSYVWKMTAYNATNGLNSGFSSTYSMSTTETISGGAPNVPGNFTAVKNPSSPTDQINVTWTAPAVDGGHSAQTGYKVYADGVQKGGNLASGATSYTITGMIPSDVVTVTVRAFNASGDGPQTTGINVTMDASAAVVMLMGCSNSENDHGGDELWDGWRCYTSGSRDSLANRSGGSTPRPKFLAYSEEGSNLGGSNPDYTTIYNHVLSELNDFYYNGTGNTPSTRASVKLYWSNGNENSDKGALTLPHTQAKFDAYEVSMQALYDAVHYAPGGVRRFPNAYAGSNPTQNQEQAGDVEGWLHQTAHLHDFVMWSMYPPGRQTTSDVPTYNFPSFLESRRTNLQDGFLIRCFYRTFQAQAAARATTGNANFKIAIGCGEIGTGDTPGEQNWRPYYITHAFAGAMYILASQYGLDMPFACYWDNQKKLTGSQAWDPAAPQNVLNEGTDGQGTTIRGEPVGTSPSSAEAWRNWTSYDHRRGGTHPGSWAGLPAAINKYTGTKV